MRRPAALKLLSGITAAGGLFQPAPLFPPVDWFSDETADAAPERFTVWPDGSCSGIVAPAGRCLLDGSGDCWTVPRPADGRGSTLTQVDGDNEEYYIGNQGNTPCADGTLVATGVLAGMGGHARPGIGAGSAGDHYANTAHQQARVRYVWSDSAGNGVGGVVAVGCLWPEVTERDIAGILASATSIDYRWIQDEKQFRLVGSCLVNIGGLPSRYIAALDGPGMAITEQWVRDNPDMPSEFVAALGFTPTATVGTMRRRLRYCQSCPPVDRTAAFRAVTPAGPAWFAEVSYPGGIGAFCDVIQDPTGAELWIVHPVVDDQIDEMERVAVPAEQATLTGRKFEYVEVAYDAVVDGTTPVAGGMDEMYAAARQAAATPLPGSSEAEINGRIDDLANELRDVAGAVSRIEQLLIDQALAGVDALPIT